MASKRKTGKKWSQHVTETSNAMDIEQGTFASDDPEKIARSVERDAERSTRRKSTPYRSAMSMLTFYINRGGKNLTAKHRKVLEDAKDVLREKFGPGSEQTSKSRSTAKKRSAKKAISKKRAVKKGGASRKKARSASR
jgi:arylamine N-acetyltransferase